MYLFLIITVLSALPALITANVDSTGGLKAINDGRRIFAKKFNVANMNELEFDDDLANYALSLQKKCLSRAELITDKRYEVIPVFFKRPFSYPRYLDAFRSLGETSLTNPGQTKIGCIDDRVHCKDVDYNLIFVMGPLKKMSVVKNGPPGSQCDEGRVNRNGLCAKKQ